MQVPPEHAAMDYYSIVLNSGRQNAGTSGAAAVRMLAPCIHNYVMESLGA